MEKAQIALIIIMGILVVVFFVLLALSRKNNKTTASFGIHRKRKDKVKRIFSTSLDIKLDLETIHKKNGKIDYFAVCSDLSSVIGDKKLVKYHETARKILSEYDYCLFDNDNLTQAILKFQKLTQFQSSDFKVSGDELIRQIKIYNKNKLQSEKYSMYLSWLFRVMEIVGFVLAIISIA